MWPLCLGVNMVNKIERIIEEIEREIARYERLKLEEQDNRTHVILYIGAAMALQRLKEHIIYG